MMSGSNTPFIPPLVPSPPSDPPRSQTVPGPTAQPMQRPYWPPQAPGFPPGARPPEGPFYGAGMGTPYSQPFILPQPYSAPISGHPPVAPLGPGGLPADYTGLPPHIPPLPTGQAKQFTPQNPAAWNRVHPNTVPLHHGEVPPSSPWYPPQGQPQRPMHYSTPIAGLGGVPLPGDPFAGGGWPSPPSFNPDIIPIFPPPATGGARFHNISDGNPAGAWPRYGGAQPVRPQRRRTFGDMDNQVPKWAPGRYYGPVLTPLQLKILEARLEVNPLLLPAPEKGERIYLEWNMLMPSSLAHRSDDPQPISWSKGRSEPATFPRITQLRIASNHFTWYIKVRAHDKEAGVTCGEVIDAIAKSMNKLTSASDYNSLSKEKQAMVKRAYRYNRSRSADVPGGRLGEGLKRMDFLCDFTAFGGLEVDENIVRKTCGVVQPGYVVLNCLKARAPLEPEQTSIQTIHNTIVTGVAVLDRLLPHICPDAATDSCVRSPPPRCHPGTCEGILNILSDWLISHLWKIFWLSGPAGVGKSAVAQTFAEICLSQGRLGAAYFFIRSSDSHHPRTVIPSLTYQLAVNVPDYEKILGQAISQDPSISHKTRRVQLQKLIVEPFMLLCDQKPEMAEKPFFIIIDGLDECRSVETQCEIVEMIGEVVRLQKDLPLLWLITSRPEPHLQCTFSQADFSIDCNKEVLRIDEDTRDGVDCYLRDSFEDMRTKFSPVIDAAWPSEEQLQSLEDITSGLFALAATSIRYVFDIEYGDPMRRLTDFFAFMSNMDRTDIPNPLQALDRLYSQILSEIPEDVYPITKRILAFHLAEGLSHSSVSLCCCFLGIERNVFRGAVKKLHSLFDIPSKDVEGRMCANHPSFRDYLRSQCRSGKFYISNDYIANCISKDCLSWYKTVLKDPHWVSDDSFREIYSSATATVLPGVGSGGARVAQLIRESAGHMFWEFLASLGPEFTAELLSELEDFDFRYVLVNDGPLPNFSRFAEHWDPHTILLHTKPEDQVERTLLDKVVTQVNRRMEPAVFPMVEIDNPESPYQYIFIGYGIRSCLFWFDEKCFLTGRCRLSCKVPTRDTYSVSDCVIHLSEESILD